MAIKHANERDGTIVAPFTQLRKNYSAVSTNSGSSKLTSIASYRTCRDAGARAIVGPAISATNEYVALLAGLDDMPNLAYWSSSPTLSDKTTYPYFGRPYPSDKTRAPKVIETLRLFNLTNFAIVYTDDAWANAFVKLVRDEAERPGNATSVNVINSFSLDYVSRSTSEP